MVEDIGQVFGRKQAELEKLLGEAELNQNQKKLVLTAMEFGHAAAYCARTCDMNGSFFAGDQYEGSYQGFKIRLG